MRGRAIGSLLAAVCCWGGVGFGQEDARRPWRALFSRADPSSSTRQIRAVLKACGYDAARLKALMQADDAYEAFTSGWHRKTLDISEDKTRRTTELAFRVPKGYAPKRSYPLLLAAHGQGGSGEQIGKSMALLLGPAVERYLIVAPTLPDKHRGFVASPVQVQAHLDALAWARRTLNVDDDRIYVSGYGQGGMVAWHLAVMHPRLFAAAVAMAGMPYFEGAPYTITCYLENLDHLPVWAIWGAKDVARRPTDLGNAGGCRIAARRLKQLDNAHFRATELPDAGHYDCWPRARDFARYLAAHKRAPPPSSFRHFFHSPLYVRGYYVEALKGGRRPLSFDRPIRLELPATQPTPPRRREAVVAAGRQLAKQAYKMWVEADRSRNTLLIRPFGVTKVRVYVREGLLDLSAAAEVRFGRAKWQGKVPASARCMLLHYAKTRDATAPIYNEIEMQILGKVVVVHE